MKKIFIILTTLLLYTAAFAEDNTVPNPATPNPGSAAATSNVAPGTAGTAGAKRDIARRHRKKDAGTAIDEGTSQV